MTTVNRRVLLAAGAAGTAGAAATLAGCAAGGGREPGKPGPAERAARAEAALRTRSAAAGRALLARYDAVLAAHPALTGRLAPLRAAVAAHATALGEGGTTPAPPLPSSAPPAAPGSSGSSGSPGHAPTGSAPAKSTATATATATGPAVPADPDAALRELAAAVRATADIHTAALDTAPPEYARLLASVAAAGAAQTFLLTTETEGDRG
ncbi:hypothetical protein ACGFRB_31195 [Streptomyces sp. NPDC048718]|uniref:hypothetical protein n=1 Tax=Streptomyces sp. NPDC048718 TaxID=3365587 RepID=UPI00371DF92F